MRCIVMKALSLLSEMFKSLPIEPSDYKSITRREQAVFHGLQQPLEVALNLLECSYKCSVYSYLYLNRYFLSPKAFLSGVDSSTVRQL